MKKATFLILLSFLFLGELLANEKIRLQKEKWELLKYSSLPANVVSFLDSKMIIGVNSSSSPSIYPLKNVSKYSKFKIKAKIIGSLSLDPIIQGNVGKKGSDDFRLRVGLVYQGETTLNFFQRKIAAHWILKLYSLAPKGTGVSRIEFFSTFLNHELKGKKRNHPLSDILKETFVLEVSKAGYIDQVVEIPTDNNILAVWISSNGDGSKSSFKLQIESLELIN